MNKFPVDLKPILEKSILFSGTDCSKLAEEMENDSSIIYKKLDPEDNLFHMSCHAGSIGIVISGKINVEKILPNGQFITIASKTPGTMIGEAAVFSKAGVYPCELNAVEKSELILIQKEKLLSILQSDSRILQNFLTELSTMTFVLQSKVEMLSYSGITSKIAFFLLTQSKQTGSDIINIPESVTNFSNILHVSRTSLHREIAGLQKAKAIKISHKQIQILDKEKLEEYLQK